MPDPIRSLIPPTREHDISAAEDQARACLPPEPAKCEAPPNQSLAAPVSSPASTEPLPSQSAVDALVSRARRRPPAADSPSERAAERKLSPRAETGVTRSGDHYADIALLRGVSSKGDTYEFMAATAQAGGHGELSAAAFRVQSRTSDGKVSVTSELLTAKATVSSRMFPGCDGPHVVAGVTAAQSEWTYRSNSAEETSLGLFAGAGFEGGICVRDKDGDALPEVCIRLGVGPVTVTDCAEAEPPREGGEMGTGGGPSRNESPPSLGAGGAPGR